MKENTKIMVYNCYLRGLPHPRPLGFICDILWATLYLLAQIIEQNRLDLLLNLAICSSVPQNSHFSNTAGCSTEEMLKKILLTFYYSCYLFHLVQHLSLLTVQGWCVLILINGLYSISRASFIFDIHVHYILEFVYNWEEKSRIQTYS